MIILLACSSNYLGPVSTLGFLHTESYKGSLTSFAVMPKEGPMICGIVYGDRRSSYVVDVDKIRIPLLRRLNEQTVYSSQNLIRAKRKKEKKKREEISHFNSIAITF